jgi:hypothetical protein
MKNWICAVLLALSTGLAMGSCASQQQIEGFDYRCFERCHEHGQTDRACVQECTDEQSVRSKSRGL